MQIDSDPVVLRVAVEEHAKLQKRIWGVFNAGNHASRGEGGLFHVSMEILRVLVEHKAAKLLHWKLFSRPDLGDIKRVEPKRLWVRHAGLHDLHVSSPFNLLATFNSSPEVSFRIIGIFTTHSN